MFPEAHADLASLGASTSARSGTRWVLSSRICLTVVKCESRLTPLLATEGRRMAAPGSCTVGLEAMCPLFEEVQRIVLRAGVVEMLCGTYMSLLDSNDSVIHYR